MVDLLCFWVHFLGVAPRWKFPRVYEIDEVSGTDPLPLYAEFFRSHAIDRSSWLYGGVVEVLIKFAFWVFDDFLSSDGEVDRLYTTICFQDVRIMLSLDWAEDLGSCVGVRYCWRLSSYVNRYVCWPLYLPVTWSVSVVVVLVDKKNGWGPFLVEFPVSLMWETVMSVELRQVGDLLFACDGR